MAIYHASVKAFSRGQGHSGTAAAAYRAGIAIADELTGTRHDYTRRKGVASVDMLAPEGAPAWARDPAECFNRSEQAETRANARVGRELEVALPCELDEQQRRALAQDLGQLLVDRYGVAVLVAVHEPDKGGDERNHHAHLLMTPRQIGPEGLGARACAEFDARGGAGPAAIKALREAVAERINAHLARAQLTDRVDHRSLPEQAKAAEAEGQLGFAAVLAREATQHEGKTATRMRRRGEHSERAAANDAVRAGNRIELTEYLRRLEKEGRLMETPPRHSQEAAQAERRKHTKIPAPTAAKPQTTTAAAPAARRLRVATGKAPPPTQRAGPTKGPRLVVEGMKAEDAAYFRQRQREAEERMRDAEHAAREWLAMIEKSGRDAANWVRQMIEACNPERAQVHARTPGFLTMAAELREDMRQAARDNTRWPRRLDAYERAKMKLDDAKREQAKENAADRDPGFWCKPATKREWAERRRRRQGKVDKARSRRNDARTAVAPEAQTKYTRQAQESMARLERTIATMQARYPLDADQAHTLPPRSSIGPTPDRKLTPEQQRAHEEQERQRRAQALNRPKPPGPGLGR